MHSFLKYTYHIGYPSSIYEEDPFPREPLAVNTLQAPTLIEDDEKRGGGGGGSIMLSFVTLRRDKRRIIQEDRAHLLQRREFETFDERCCDNRKEGKRDPSLRRQTVKRGERERERADLSSRSLSLPLLDLSTQC